MFPRPRPKTSKSQDWFKSYSNVAEKNWFCLAYILSGPFWPFTEVLGQNIQLQKKILTDKYNIKKVPEFAIFSPKGAKNSLRFCFVLFF